MLGRAGFSLTRDDDTAVGLTQEQQSMLAALSRNTGSALEQAGLFLDTPGALFRGVLAGDPSSGLNWDYDKRVSGEELLKAYGILDQDSSGFGATVAGLGAEIVTDPLALITAPMSSLTKAGKAAKAANILDLAPIAAQSKMGASAANTMTGRLANAALDRLLPQGLARTPENYAVRSLVGPRVARTKTTLDDVVRAAPDPAAAMEKVNNYLYTKGLDYDAVRDQKLGGAFGLGLFSPMITFTPPGSEKVLDALDAAGQAVAWSYPARLASAAFDERVAGMIDPGDQLAALRQFNALDAARSSGRRMALEHAETVTRIPMSDRAKSLLGSDSLMSEQGNDFLTRVFEGKTTATDRALMRELPGIDQAAASWDRLRRNNVAEAQRLGLDYNELRDPRFGVEYSPRSGTEFDFGEYGTGFGRSMYQSRVYEDFSRNPALFTPGGTMDLREVSRLPSVRALSRNEAGVSPYQVGTEIANYINRKHGYQAIDQTQGEAIARTMKRLNRDLPADLPAFAGHPLNEQTRVIISQEVARANANYVYDSLAESAINAQANRLAGGNFRRLDSAMQDIATRTGLKTGAAGMDPAVRQQLTDRIASRMGINPAQVDLSQMAIPEEVYNRLSRVQDFYNSPRVQKEVSGMFDSMTQFWKASLLAFPARHARDLFSNAAAVWLETGDPLATTWGFGVAKQVLAGNIDSVLPKIAQLPQYRNITNQAALKTKFLGDVAASGILTGLSQSDVLAARRSGELSRIMPGLQPVSRMDAFAQLIPDGSRSPLQMAGDALQVKGLTNQFETRNPVFNWSQKLGDANDSIARLGGFLALLSKGVAPEVAVQRMHNALVNYDSLTTMERGFLRKIFPWWAYNSRIGKYVVQNLIDHPGGSVAQMVRGSNVVTRSDEDTYVPARLRQELAIRIPDPVLDFFGVQLEPGAQAFVNNIDLPGIDAAFGIISPDGISETLRNLLSQANPFIKGVGELAFDEDLFSKRPLRSADPPINKLYRRMTGDNLSPLAKVVGSNIPGTQRLVGVAGSLLDDRNDPATNALRTLVNTFAPFKSTVVTPEWMADDAERQLYRRMSPLMGEMAINFVDKEKLANASPEEQQLAGVLKAIQRQRRAANKNQAATGPAIPYPAGLMP